MNAISNNDDVIDSRDVIERIEEMDDSIAASLAMEPEGVSWGELAEDHADLLDAEDAAELRALRALAAEGADYAPDWECGATLIRDSYFKDYAMELADDIGAVPSEYSWPTSCIDWDQAARELRMDYSSVDFDGVTYWVR